MIELTALPPRHFPKQWRLRDPIWASLATAFHDVSSVVRSGHWVTACEFSRVLSRLALSSRRPWIPDASLAERSGTLATEFIWAALDCPSGFALLPVPEGKTLVLGELCARVGSAVRPGDRCVVIGWPLHVDGRKHCAGSAIFTESGDAVAVGRATWIEVPVTAFTSESPCGQ